MFSTIKRYQNEIFSSLIGLYFILLMQVKAAYTTIPLLLAFAGIIILIPIFRQRNWKIEKYEKWLIISVTTYFLLFLLSLLIHGGKTRELDFPSKALLLLTIIPICLRARLKNNWIISAILLGSSLAALIAIYRFFILNMPYVKLFPIHMYIQAGGMIMTLGLFNLGIAFYFYRKKSTAGFLFALVASGLAILASLVNQARGAWMAAPLIVMVILFLNRKLLSKWFIICLAAFTVIGSFTTGDLIKTRWQQASQEITHYFSKKNKSTSVGGRLDMWKSALIGIEEKPIFGRGVEAISEMRQEHFEQGFISKYASTFQNTHNQYLHDASARGILGLLALLAVFFVPLWIFWHNLKGKEAGTLPHMWGVLGITHVLGVMGYCLTQGFLSHNSGTMFYFFTVFLLLGLQKSSVNQPPVEIK